MFDKGGGKKNIEDAKGVPMGNLVFDGGLNENTGSEVFDFCFCVVLLGFEAFLVVGVTCETELAKREDRVFHKPVRLLPA